MGCGGSKETAKEKKEEKPKDEKPKEEKPKEEKPKEEKPKDEKPKDEKPTPAEEKPKDEQPQQEEADQTKVEESGEPKGASAEPVEEEKAAPAPETEEPSPVPPLNLKGTAHETPENSVAVDGSPGTAALSPYRADGEATGSPGGMVTPRRQGSPLRKEGNGDSAHKHSVEGTVFLLDGPSVDFPYTSIYRCFDEGNGLLFRLVNERRHMWAFYNDSEDYVMHISVSFGNESAVKPLGVTTQEVHDAVTGHCTLDVSVNPGDTQPFMRGDYNGFVTRYDAEPIEK